MKFLLHLFQADDGVGVTPDQPLVSPGLYFIGGGNLADISKQRCTFLVKFICNRAGQSDLDQL